MAETMVAKVSSALREKVSEWKTATRGQAGAALSYDDMARAAIEAMREPTHEMKFGQGEAWPDVAGRVYRAMIDAALKEEGNGR